MRFITFKTASGQAVAVRRGDDIVALDLEGLPHDLPGLVAGGWEVLQQAYGRAPRGRLLNPVELEFLPPIPAPPKIICVGLNYLDHAAEASIEPPQYPAFFSRYATSLIGHRQPLVRPRVSEQFDFEGELVAIVGRRGRCIPRELALEFVAGYSVFQDASVRDYQFKSSQWTPGKNFDASGGFGPELVTAEELPEGARGLMLRTRLNGNVVQSASTADMIFDVSTLISLASEVMTLEPGDVLVTGTPAGVGFARKPPLFMQAGDICQVEVEGIGTLVNPVIDEPD